MSPLQVLVLLTAGVCFPPVLSLGAVIEPPSKPLVVCLEAAAAPPGATAVLMRVDDEDAGEGAGQLTVVARAHDIEPGGPWLGIQFGPVSRPLAAQLGLESDTGQMVLNVVTDSPADAAGIQQYDVIVNIDGTDTPGEVGKFLEIVRGFSAGETHTFSIIRDGRPVQVSVTIGTRPDLKKGSKYKYEDVTPELSRGRLFQRGGIILKDDDGNWIFKRLDELGDLKHIFRFMPRFGENDLSFEWQAGSPGDGCVFEFRMDKGKSVSIRRDADGRITVTTTERQGDEETTTTRTYENEEEFEKADPDTYKMYKSDLHLVPGAHGRLFGLHGGHGHDFDFDIDIDLDDLHASIEEARKEMEEALKSHGDALKGLKGRMRILRKHADGDADDEAAESGLPDRKARTTFRVAPDGSIRVTTRRGDDELVEEYADADQLKEARPELYEKLEALQDAQLEGIPER